MKLYLTFGIMLPLRFLFPLHSFIHSLCRNELFLRHNMNVPILNLSCDRKTEGKQHCMMQFIFSIFFYYQPSPISFEFHRKKKHSSCLPLFLMSWQIQISGKLQPAFYQWKNVQPFINSKGHSDLVFLQAISLRHIGWNRQWELRVVS